MWAQAELRKVLAVIGADVIERELAVATPNTGVSTLASASADSTAWCRFSSSGVPLCPAHENVPVFEEGGTHPCPEANV